MNGIILVILLSLLAIYSTYRIKDDSSQISDKISAKLGNLWNIAHQGMKENKLLRAEKALLTILKIDEKNSAAYNRLGILYAKQKNYKDAVDCFEIASSLELSPSSFHNLGLIYYETQNYNKASIAFEEALRLDDSLAARHIAYAKVQEKLGNNKKLISELEKATEIEPSKEAYSLLLKAYEANSMQEEAKKIKKYLEKSNQIQTKKKIDRPKRVIV